MSYLYLWLNIGSFFIPFLFSFHPKLQFYKKWNSLIAAILIMMVIFISWDVIFTKEGIWGFNETYLSGYQLLNLPLEEWLFFICIPYAGLFTHYSLLYFFPKLTLSGKVTSYSYVLLITTLLVVLLYYYDRWYTVINFGYAIFLLGLVYNYNRQLLNSFFPTFLVILLPFFIINGILTGSGLESPVVWYDDTENLGIRLLTIPIEDIIYAFTMLLTVLSVTDYLENRKSF
jgi:lycopene cyclase domain-containing protein